MERACADDPLLFERLPEIVAALDAAPDSPRVGSEGELSPDSLVEAFNLALDAAPSEVRGARIGPYKLLQEIGRGGFGVVWMAEQDEPIRRRVALKIIKAGMDTREVIARFEAERQALALMEHPNIAHVFDAGATEAGRPYFAMELVRGVAITKYCDENRLPVEERLRLFMMVCHAVQHAHQKGVIHRDLKPSNILVTLHDGVPVPKVIDFGIAKAVKSRLTEKTLFTQFHAFIGTPAYTSPEQMEMSGLDVDTRSDIYSLGVLLYELLTGQPPFDAGALAKSGLEAMRRTIRDVDPPRPSHLLQTMSKEDRVTVARQRNTEASKLPLLVYGDLDWIVMRCLEKDRTRRYEAASGLARDIQRHLDNEPVSARPPSTTYVLRRLVRRNKLLFAAIGTVAAVLVLGLVASTWEAVRATRAERIAASERSRAEDMLTFMLGDLRAQVSKVGRLDALESIGDKATAYFASRDSRDLSDTELARYSKALTQIGGIRMDQARYDEAAAAFSEAYSRAVSLAARHPRDGDVLFDRGQAEYFIGYLDERRGEYSAAEVWLTRYHDTCAGLVALDPSRPDWRSELAYSQHNLATLCVDRGDLDGARTGFLAALSMLEGLLQQNPGDLDILDGVSDADAALGNVDEQQGEFADALKQFSIQKTLVKQLISKEPANPQWRKELADGALEHEALVDTDTGQLAAAGERMKEARGLIDVLVAHDPFNLHWQAISLNTQLIDATLARKNGDPVMAAQLLEEIRPQLEYLRVSEPSNRRFDLWLATTWRLEAQLRASSDPRAAAAAAARAVELVEKLIRQGRAINADFGECAKAYEVAGEIAAQAGDTAAAQGHWQHAAEILAPRMHGTRDWRLLDPAARVAAFTGHTKEARDTISKLTGLGYVPLDPWPELERPDARTSNPNP